MPIPKPKTGEEQDEFIDRCMGNDSVLREFPDNKQRAAVCHQTWRDKDKVKKSMDETLKFAKIEEAADGTFNVDGVEIFMEGDWKGKKFGEKELGQMVWNFHHLSEEVKPGLKLGHVDHVTEEDPETGTLKAGMSAPRFGTMSNVARAGKVLLANFSKVPKKLAELIEKGAYPRISIELWHKFTNSAGELYENVIDAVALLGSELPEVTTLADIVSLYENESITAELVTYDKEARNVVGYEYARCPCVSTLEKYGVLKDTIVAEKEAQFIQEILFRAGDLSGRILRGDGEFEENSPEQRAALVNEVMQDVRDLLNNEELRGSFWKKEAGIDPSREGTQPTEGEMPEEELTEKLSQTEKDRDEFSKTADAEKVRADKAETDLADERQKQAVKNAETDAKAFFDALDGKLFPFERDIAEPIMAASLAVRDSETPMKFAKGADSVDVADGIKGLFEQRKDLPESLFTQVLETSDPKKSVVLNATDELDKLASAHAAENKVSYEAAFKAVRRENRELAEKADAENPASAEPVR